MEDDAYGGYIWLHAGLRMHMEDAYGECIWWVHMVDAYGGCIWRMHAVEGGRAKPILIAPRA